MDYMLGNGTYNILHGGKYRQGIFCIDCSCGIVQMTDWVKSLLFFILWTCLSFWGGYVGGKNSAQKDELQKDVQTYQTRENNTTEQEKTAEKIKIVYRDLKSDEKDCDFVLNFDVSKCLPK